MDLFERIPVVVGELQDLIESVSHEIAINCNKVPLCRQLAEASACDFSDSLKGKPKALDVLFLRITHLIHTK
jgi:hypothetical protein